jgi:translocation and assembly module TamB
MKRLTRRGLAAAVLLALTGTVSALVFWTVATTNGTRWILKTLPSWAGISFSAQKIDGRLIDHLLLSQVRLSMAQQTAEVDTFELHWQPLLLLTGKLAVPELTVDGVRIQDDAPSDNTPLNLNWPGMLPGAYLFDGRIARVQVTNLSYRSLQEQPVEVTSFAASVTWQDDLLSIRNLAVVSPSGRISGSVSAGFKHPSLISELTLVPSQPVAEMDAFSLLLERSSAKGPEQFFGRLSIAGTAANRKLLELTGDVGITPTGLNLHSLNLTRPDQPGMASIEGSIAVTGPEPVFSLQVGLTGLNLRPEVNIPTDLSGTLTLSGTVDQYQGEFSLTNKAQGWQAATLSIVYQGTAEGLRLTSLAGSALEGTLAGQMDIDWRKGLALRGAIKGRNLNLAGMDPGWEGVVNFTATGYLEWSGSAPLRASVRASLLESRLHGRALTGEVQADFADNNLFLARLALQGKGFDLQASGELNRRLNLTAQISDFSRLVPGASGTLQAEGWMRFLDQGLSGALIAKGSKLAYLGMRIASADLSARSDQGTGFPLHITASLKDVVYDKSRLNAVTLKAAGTLPHHTMDISLRSTAAEAQLTLAAGYKDGIWKGEINRLTGKDNTGPWNLAAPSSFTVSAGKVFLSPLAITAGVTERLEVAADLSLNPLLGQVRAQWTDINLSRATPYLEDGQISGKSNGFVKFGLLSEKRLTLAGNAAISGTYSEQGHSITLKRGTIAADGGEQGLRVALDLDTADRSGLKGAFTSPAPLRQSLPEKGGLTVDLSGIDMMLLKPWLPPDTRLEGRISGRAKGIMLPGQGFELDGNAELSGGMFHQQRPDGVLNLTFQSATASWGWRGEVLTGAISLAMTEYGHIQANYQLPLAARFPFAVNSSGLLRASFSGKFQEKGIITALFPGLVQESSGELNTELAVNGTWDEPKITGKLQLTKAGAYLPTAGIHLKNVQLTAGLEKNRIRIDAFQADSGPGNLKGTALIILAGWQVISYQGTIDGTNFQTVDFPELRILSTPKLTFEGTPQKLILQGELFLPELNLLDTPSRNGIAPSSDVILEGRVLPVETKSPLDLDVQVRVLLGEKIFVKVAGIDAQLGGVIDLSLSDLDRVISTGEIKVVKGRYRTYGVNLEIVRGRLFFAGSKFDNPTMDFLALRTIGDVKAGVTVTGTLQEPLTKLYSEPTLQDVDTLAYIVLGHPLGSSGEQAGLLTQAAGALLSSGKATVLQEQLKKQLGLSTFEIKGGVGGTTSYMGYKPLQVTPPGEIPTAQQAGVTETIVTVGKLLTPQLYVSYGKSLFTGNNLFRLRYDIFKKWQIETQTGSDESGADLYYKMEFK